MPRQPRIAVGAAVLRGLRVWAAREGQDPCDLATQILSDALPSEIRSLAGLEPPKPAHAEPSRPEPTEDRNPSIAADAGPRVQRSGPPPYEELHPEIAARVLAMWAGGSKKGGMSREAIAKVMQAEGIPMTAGTVSKITIRARQKINRTATKGV